MLFPPGPNGETWRPDPVSSPVWLEVIKTATMSNVNAASLRYAGLQSYEEGKIAQLPRTITSWNDTEFLDEDVDPADLDSFNHRLSLPACRFQTILKPNLMSGRERFASSPIHAPVFTT